jgi:chromosome segregation ATPase
MSAMSDQPLTVAALAEFHRQVVLPDMERLIGESERRLHNEMHGLQGAVIHRLERVEDELRSVTAGLRGLEGRLDLHESGYQDVIAAIHRLEERLSRVEKRVEDLADAQEKRDLRSEVAELRSRLDSLEARVRDRART